MANSTDYTTFTKPELMTMASDRRLIVRPSRMTRSATKQDYIKAIQTHDASKEGSFHLFVLPAETRNNIYHHILTLDRNRKCSTQILRACKLVHQEASGILYSNNVINIWLQDNHVLVQGTYCGRVAGSNALSWRRSTQPLKMGILLQDNELVWPDFLHRAQHLHVALRPQGPFEKRTFGANISTNHILHSLCKFLAQGHDVRSFELDFQSLDLQTSDYQYDSVTYPLLMLGAIDSWKIHHSWDAVWEKRHAVVRDEKAPGIMSEAVVLDRLANAYAALFQTASRRNQPLTVKPGCERRIQDGRLHVRSVRLREMLEKDWFFDAEWEIDTTAAAGHLRHALRYADIPRLLEEVVVDGEDEHMRKQVRALRECHGEWVARDAEAKLVQEAAPELTAEERRVQEMVDLLSKLRTSDPDFGTLGRIVGSGKATVGQAEEFRDCAVELARKMGGLELDEGEGEGDEMQAE